MDWLFKERARQNREGLRGNVAQCPVCTRFVLLRKDGSFYKHRLAPDSQSDRCHGSWHVAGDLAKVGR